MTWQSTEEPTKRRSKFNWLLLLLIVVAAMVGGAALVQFQPIKQVLDLGGSSGNAGGSRGSGSNARLAAPTSVTSGLGSAPASIKAAVVKINIANNGSYQFIDNGTGNMLPGQSVTNGFSVTNDGNVPITSLTLNVTGSGSQVLLANDDLSLSYCTNTGTCQQAFSKSSIASFTAPVLIFNGSLAPGASLNYKLTTSMSSNTPNSAEGQQASIAYTITAVG